MYTHDVSLLYLGCPVLMLYNLALYYLIRLSMRTMVPRRRFWRLAVIQVDIPVPLGVSLSFELDYAASDARGPLDEPRA